MNKDEVTGYYSVSYSEILPVLLEAFHQLNIRYQQDIENMKKNMIFIDESVYRIYNQLQTESNFFHFSFNFKRNLVILKPDNVGDIVDHLFQLYPVSNSYQTYNSTLIYFIFLFISLIFSCLLAVYISHIMMSYHINTIKKTDLITVSFSGSPVRHSILYGPVNNSYQLFAKLGDQVYYGKNICEYEIWDWKGKFFKLKNYS